ncbi:hypothetical protein RhiLY_09853 [Ceratobasidium sp. AG-Ba]|nr:hypothetical protein RhiLY_09853 [Ceratobasidium sp. AG-Ba]
MFNSTIDNLGLDWFDRDRVVQRVLIFGSPIPGTSVLHWRILLNIDFSGNQRSVLLDLNKGGAESRTGILLIKSVNYSTSQSAQTSFPFGVPGGITVGRFIDLVLGLKRNRYRFDSTGSGCRYWCWVVLSDFERAGFVASGSSAFFLQAIAGLAQDNPARYPIPAPEGSFYD